MKTYVITGKPRKAPVYFNTTHEVDTSQFKRQAQNQDDHILEFFREHPFNAFSPSYVWQKVFPDNVPITSVRRSITNLEKAGLLTKTETKVDGIYGRPNYTWKLTHRHAYQPTLF